MDEVDDFICACQEGYSGTFCECQEGDNSTLADDQCVDINTTLSWTLPPDLMIDMEEDYDGVVVAGTSVSVGFEDITEVAGTIVPLEGTTDGEAMMATSSWDIGVEPTPTMPSGAEQTASALYLCICLFVYLFICICHQVQSRPPQPLLTTRWKRRWRWTSSWPLQA